MGTRYPNFLLHFLSSLTITITFFSEFKLPASALILILSINLDNQINVRISLGNDNRQIHAGFVDMQESCGYVGLRAKIVHLLSILQIGRASTTTSTAATEVLLDLPALYLEMGP